MKNTKVKSEGVRMDKKKIIIVVLVIIVLISVGIILKNSLRKEKQMDVVVEVEYECVKKLIFGLNISNKYYAIAFENLSDELEPYNLTFIKKQDCEHQTIWLYEININLSTIVENLSTMSISIVEFE